MFAVSARSYSASVNLDNFSQRHPVADGVQRREHSASIKISRTRYNLSAAIQGGCGNYTPRGVTKRSEVDV